MNIDFLKILIDFGLLVLIWKVQLFNYPAFTFFKEENLAQWHKVYLRHIAIVVGPLMLFQTSIYSYQVFTDYSIWNLVGFILIALIWINTIFFAVPRHRQITRGESPLKAARELVIVNWPRTVLWNLVFVLGMMDHIVEKI